MLPLIAAVAVFVAVVALVLAIVNQPGPASVERRLSQMKVEATETEIDNVLRSDSGTFPFLRRLATGGAWSDKAKLDLQQAGWRLKVSEYLLIRLFVAVLAVVAVVLILRGSALVIPIALVAAVIGFMLPAFLLTNSRNRRVAKINSQLAEALVLVSNSLRAGFAFTQSVELAAKQLEPPIKDEFNRFLRDVSLGAPTNVALQEMADRAASYDLEMMVATILVQRSSGGNLSEILDNVSGTIRDRERLVGEIRALTASQRFSGLILSIWPIILAGFFILLVPNLWKVMWEEEAGRVALVIAGVLEVAGIVTIRRILRPDW